MGSDAILGRKVNAAARSMLIAVAVAVAIASLVIAPSLATNPARRSGILADADAGPTGIHKIKHIIVITQENRSFDSYFGTYPGADGIPMKNGLP